MISERFLKTIDQFRSRLARVFASLDKKMNKSFIFRNHFRENPNNIQILKFWEFPNLEQKSLLNLKFLVFKPLSQSFQ